MKKFDNRKLYRRYRRYALDRPPVEWLKVGMLTIIRWGKKKATKNV